MAQLYRVLIMKLFIFLSLFFITTVSADEGISGTPPPNKKDREAQIRRIENNDKEITRLFNSIGALFKSIEEIDKVFKGLYKNRKFYISCAAIKKLKDDIEDINNTPDISKKDKNKYNKVISNIIKKEQKNISQQFNKKCSK